MDSILTFIQRIQSPMSRSLTSCDVQGGHPDSLVRIDAGVRGATE